MEVDLEEFDDDKGNTFDTCIVRVNGKQVGYLGKPDGCRLNFLPACGLNKKQKEEVVRLAAERKKSCIPGWVEALQMDDPSTKINEIDK